MKERILAELKKIETDRNVRVLYAVEAGSRAWGFASEDSDYDVRFLYARSVRDYLRVAPMRDVIELPLVDDLDINGWDLFKALGLFLKTNPPLLEWLYSPIVYVERGGFAARLRELARSQFSLKRMTYHYLSMTKGNYKDYIAGKSQVVRKKYLYAMRPLLCIRWMEQRQTPAPTSVHDMLEDITLDAEVRTAFLDLIAKKREGGEVGAGEPEPILTTFIEREIERIEALVANLPDDRFDTEELNALAWNELSV